MFASHPAYPFGVCRVTRPETVPPWYTCERFVYKPYDRSKTLLGRLLNWIAMLLNMEPMFKAPGPDEHDLICMSYTSEWDDRIVWLIHGNRCWMYATKEFEYYGPSVPVVDQDFLFLVASFLSFWTGWLFPYQQPKLPFQPEWSVQLPERRERAWAYSPRPPTLR